MSWIKFSESKPSVEDKNYFIAVKYLNYDKISFYEVSFWDGEHFTYWDGYDDCEMSYKDDEVYAWMEIPECEVC